MTARGSVFKRKKSWAYIVELGFDADGRRQQRWHSGFGTKREAERALRDVLHAMDSHSYVEPSTLTLADYLRSEWLPAVAPPNLRESSWASYRAELEKHVIPHIGEIPLQDLHALRLNRMYADLLRNGRRDGAGGLSPRTVRYAHTILRKALADAVRWGRVDRNVADLATPPRQHHAAADEHMRTWTAPQLRRFLVEAAGERLYVGWLLGANTGMRRGEVLGLRWRDVDLDAATLAVRQTLVLIAGIQHFSQPKTRRSRRSIAIDARTVATLRDWQDHQAGERREWGRAWVDSGLVITRENGEPVNPEWWSDRFVQLARQAGLPVIRLHDLRHTHATLLLASGVNPKVASERLGHHSAAFTLDVYAHVIPGMQADAAQRITDLIFDEEGDG